MLLILAFHKREFHQGFQMFLACKDWSFLERCGLSFKNLDLKLPIVGQLRAGRRGYPPMVCIHPLHRQEPPRGSGPSPHEDTSGV